MPNSLEVALKFGVSAGRAKKIAEFLDVELDDDDFETDYPLERAAREAIRDRISSYTLAFLALGADDRQREFIFNLAKDEQALRAAYDELNPDNVLDAIVPGMKEILDSVSTSPGNKKTDEWLSLIKWIEGVLKGAGREVSYNYLAVRLLLCLPHEIRGVYPRVIAPLLNKAKHRGFLDGWFRYDETSGKRKTIYHAPAQALHSSKPARKPKVVIQDFMLECARRVGVSGDEAVARYIIGPLKQFPGSDYADVLAALRNCLNENKFDL